MPRIARSIAVLSALATFAGGGVASAAVSHAGANAAGGQAVQTQTTVVVAISAFPTGPGRGRAARCQAWTMKLQATNDALNADLDSGDDSAAAEDAEHLENQANSAMDAGCAVIY